MTYPQWWERLVAGIVDGVILAVVQIILAFIFIAAAGPIAGGLVAMLLTTAIVVGYKVFFESGTWQATPGKMAFGLKVSDATGARAPMQQVFMRTWPWWLGLIQILGYLLFLPTVFSVLLLLAYIAIFVTFFVDPQGRCIHDKTANLHVIKAGKGMIAQ